jgi:cold shock CspA family protein
MTAAARLAAKLLAHRPTPQEEVGDLIRNVHGALTRLTEPQSETASPPQPVSAVTARRPRQRAEPAPAAALPEEPATAPPPAPKLVRRADVAPAATPAPLLSAPAHHNALRGVVRWFDPKSGKGALRLPGVGDIGFESAVLAQSGISRLFKGQEIEATLVEGAVPPQLERLALPGAVAASPLGGGVVRGRHAKPVVVELKREALRRAAARAEAEHVLGGPPRR